MHAHHSRVQSLNKIWNIQGEMHDSTKSTSEKLDFNRQRCSSCCAAALLHPPINSTNVYESWSDRDVHIIPIWIRQISCPIRLFRIRPPFPIFQHYAISACLLYHIHILPVPLLSHSYPCYIRVWDSCISLLLFSSSGRTCTCTTSTSCFNSLVGSSLLGGAIVCFQSPS